MPIWKMWNKNIYETTNIKTKNRNNSTPSRNYRRRWIGWKILLTDRSISKYIKNFLQEKIYPVRLTKQKKNKTLIMPNFN